MRVQISSESLIAFRATRLQWRTCRGLGSKRRLSVRGRHHSIIFPVQSNEQCLLVSVLTSDFKRMTWNNAIYSNKTWHETTLTVKPSWMMEAKAVQIHKTLFTTHKVKETKHVLRCKHRFYVPQPAKGCPPHNSRSCRSGS